MQFVEVDEQYFSTNFVQPKLISEDKDRLIDHPSWKYDNNHL